MQFEITVPNDFNYQECLLFLNRNSDEILYSVNDGSIERLIKVDDQFIAIHVKLMDDVLIISHNGQEALNDQIKKYITHWFDLSRDLSPFYETISKEKSLLPLLNFRGLRIIGIPDLFEALCWTIIGQQINLAFAYKLKARLTTAFGESLKSDGKRLWHFPEPKKLLEISERFREENQFSRSKVKYLMNTAEAFEDGTISLEKLKELQTFQERQDLLTQVKGIGEWSANYALMKTLHQPEAIPFGDTGLTQALFNLGIVEDRKDRPAIEAFFKTVKGWEAYTSFYLWRSLY